MGSVTRAFGASCALVLAAACASTTSVETLPAAHGRTLKKIAMTPFMDRVSDGEAGALVTGKVLESLGEIGGFDVVPPHDVDHALRSAGSPKDPRAVGHALHAAFGCDAIASGSVARYSARVGGPRGVTRAASVAFTLELRDPSGVLLWQGHYDETQQDLSENLFGLGRARERSFQWVTADALADYGARELARELKEDAASWK